jgi:hypothetical protein
VLHVVEEERGAHALSLNLDVYPTYAYTLKHDASDADVCIFEKDGFIFLCKLQWHDNHKLCAEIEINRHKSSFTKHISFYEE